jgi:hypothetical protein
VATAGPKASPKYIEACRREKIVDLLSFVVTSAAYDCISARVVRKAPVIPPMTNSSRIRYAGNLSGYQAAITETASPDNIPRALNAMNGLRPYWSDHFPRSGLLTAHMMPDSRFPSPKRRPRSVCTAVS